MHTPPATPHTLQQQQQQQEMQKVLWQTCTSTPAHNSRTSSWTP
jgi:hypothetical protein